MKTNSQKRPLGAKVLDDATLATVQGAGHGMGGGVFGASALVSLTGQHSGLGGGSQQLDGGIGGLGGGGALEIMRGGETGTL